MGAPGRVGEVGAGGRCCRTEIVKHPSAMHTTAGLRAARVTRRAVADNDTPDHLGQALVTFFWTEPMLAADRARSPGS